MQRVGHHQSGGRGGAIIFFDIEVNWRDLSVKDRKTCSYVMNHIDKLLFGVPPGVKPYSISAVGNIVSERFKAVCKSENSVVAYKGGHYEKDLLASLGIPALDLGGLWLPKGQRFNQDNGVAGDLRSPFGSGRLRALPEG